MAISRDLAANFIEFGALVVGSARGFFLPPERWTRHLARLRQMRDGALEGGPSEEELRKRSPSLPGRSPPPPSGQMMYGEGERASPPEIVSDLRARDRSPNIDDMWSRAQRRGSA